MKVIILTQYYPPEHGAPQNRLHDLARRWVSAGVRVSVLTAMPNYPRGKVFPEYRWKIFHKEIIDGVKVTRAPIFISGKKSAILQLMNYFSFMCSSTIAGVLSLRKSDYLICESPPLFLGGAALVLKFFTRSALVMNISDLWPESAVQLGMIGRGPSLSLFEWFEKLLYRKSRLVTCQTRGIEAGVKKSCPETETFLFPNGVDLDMFRLQGKNRKLRAEMKIPEDVFVVGYGGNHGRSQALEQVLEAAEILRNEKIFFAFFGDGPEKSRLTRHVENKEINNVAFYPSQDRQKMSEIQAMWDIALVPLKNIGLFDGARPSKMFELMAGGIPFIFCGRGEGADIAAESGCAFTVPPENAAALAKEIRRVASLSAEKLSSMGKKGREFVSENFNRGRLADILLEKLEGMTD